jgi:hypothetical protein
MATITWLKMEEREAEREVLAYFLTEELGAVWLLYRQLSAVCLASLLRSHVRSMRPLRLLRGYSVVMAPYMTVCGRVCSQPCAVMCSRVQLFRACKPRSAVYLPLSGIGLEKPTESEPDTT